VGTWVFHEEVSSLADREALTPLNDVLFGWLAKRTQADWPMAIPAALSFVESLALTLVGVSLIAWAVVSFANHETEETSKSNLDFSESPYWSLTQTISWLAFGEPITSDQWKLEYPREVMGFTEHEEESRHKLAEMALTNALQDSSKLIAYGRATAAVDHSVIPESYFLSPRDAFIIDDSFRRASKLEMAELLEREANNWLDIRLKKADVLRIWPTALAGVPQRRTPKKLKAVLVHRSSPGLRAGEHRPDRVHGFVLHHFIGIQSCSDEAVDDVVIKAIAMSYGPGPTLFSMNERLPTSEGSSNRVNIHPRSCIECSLLTQIDRLDKDRKQVTVVAFGRTALPKGATKVEISISAKTQPVFTEAFRIDFDGRGVKISRWDERKGLA
jgi:hypothetical protein